MLPVHVVGDRLRAGAKPLEAHLTVESNGGTVTVLVRATVPITPFAGGALDGAKSPRQIAEKARANPKEAAVQFENGEVIAWYKANGWTYPVQGPPASGVAGVQQFFEALGLTPAPKVEINVKSVALEHNPGDSLRYVLEVKTEEKKPIYAHAKSNQTWLEVGRGKANGRTVAIPLSISSAAEQARSDAQRQGHGLFQRQPTFHRAPHASDQRDERRLRFQRRAGDRSRGG